MKSLLRKLGSAAVLSFAAASVALAQTTLTAYSWVPPHHTIHKDMLLPWIAEVAKATQGRVKFNVLPKPPANPRGTADAIRDGLADVSVMVHGYTPGRFALSKVVEFPEMGDDSESMSVAYQRIFERSLAKAGEHKGVKVLAVFVHGPGNIYNRKKPVAAINDLTGMKIRVGGGVVNDIASALGMSALLKPATESYELLSTGVADGVLFPPESIASFKLDKVVKYATIVPGGLYNTSFAMVMNQAAFDKLAKEDRDAIDAASGEKLARMAGKAWDAMDRAGEQILAGAKVERSMANAEFMRALREKVAPVLAEWVKETQAKGFDGNKLVAEYRAEIKKAAAAR